MEFVQHILRVFLQRRKKKEVGQCGNFLSNAKICAHLSNLRAQLFKIGGTVAAFRSHVMFCHQPQPLLHIHSATLELNYVHLDIIPNDQTKNHSCSLIHPVSLIICDVLCRHGFPFCSC